MYEYYIVNVKDKPTADGSVEVEARRIITRPTGKKREGENTANTLGDCPVP